MKTSNIQTTHNHAIIRGWVDGATLSDQDASGGISGGEYENDDVAALTAGTVVVLSSAGKISTTITAQDTHPVGVVLDDIDIGDFGPVAWQGPVDLVNVTASVTAGYYAETSSTPGFATENATRREGSFGYFTSSGTTPSAFLIGGGGGSGSGGFELNTDGGQSVIEAHGVMGATETFDPADGNVHTGTLDADCTFTFSAPTGTGAARILLELLEDGTGGWTPTFPGSVVWVNGVTPTHDTTAGSITIYAFMSTDGGISWFGAAGGGQITVKDEGVALATAAASLDFVGAGVVASGTGAAKTITIAGGSTATDTNIWRPLMDGGGAVVTDGSGQAVMAFGPA